MNSGTLGFPTSQYSSQYHFPTKARSIFFNFGPHYATKYQDVLDQSATRNYPIPIPESRYKQNRFMQYLVDTDTILHLDRLRVFKNSDNLLFAGIDWISPTVTENTYVSSPTLDTTKGIRGNGINSYVDTNIVLSTLTKYTLNSASVFGYFGDSLSHTSGSVWGVFDGANATEFHFQAGTTFADVNDAANATFTGFKIDYGLTINRRIIGIIYVIQNGITYIAPNAAGGVPATRSVYLCARNISGSPASFTTATISLWGCGDNLSGFEPALKTATDNFYNS